MWYFKMMNIKKLNLKIKIYKNYCNKKIFKLLNLLKT